MKLKIFITVIILLNSFFLLGQSTFKVLDNRSKVYLFAPNPISYSKYGSLRKNIKLEPYNGTLDSINKQAIWTPYPIFDSVSKTLSDSYLLIKEFKNNKWKVIDTIFPGTWRILPKDYSVEPRPFFFLDGYPDL